jgi:hypothetical protein
MGEMDTFDAITAASALIGAIGCYWIMGSLMYHEVNIFQLTFGFCLIVPGLINMSDKLGLISISPARIIAGM